MKSLLLSFLLLAVTAATHSFAQTTNVEFPVSGGSYTLNAPGGQKFSNGPVSSGNGFFFSYASTSDICLITATPNTTYYARYVTPTWSLVLKANPGISTGSITISFYQPAYVPPLYEEQYAVVYTPVIPYRIPAGL